MLTLVFDTAEGRREVDLVRARSTVGWGVHSDVRIDHPSLARLHAQVSRDKDTYLLEVATGGAKYRTFVNGRQVERATLEAGDAVVFGSVPVSVVATPAVAPDELEMVRALQAGGDAPREVYADWLESRGATREAAWVRAELELHHARTDQLRAHALAELAAIASSVSPRFRALVARPAVESCADLRCPREWSLLELGDCARERHCPRCEERVTFCDTVDEARNLSWRDERVAVEVTRPRRPGDLAPIVVIG